MLTWLSGGLWIIPLLTLLGAGFCWYKFITTKLKWSWIYASILTVATIAILIAMYSDR